MNKRDVAEIRKRLNYQKNTITCLRGCYVSAKGEVISEFNHSLHAFPREEAEKYLALFKKVLSGEIGQSLLPIDFTPEQVMDGVEHALLTEMKNSELGNENSVRLFYEKVITSVHMEENYLILLLHDGYDVPFKNQNDEVDHEQSYEVFRYILCAVCPVKLSKPALTYVHEDGEFHSKEAEWVVSAPEMGFLFPAFENRSCNIYGALTYTRDAGDNHEDFASAVMGASVCPPAREQKENFTQVLEEALEGECSLDVIQSVQDVVRARMEEVKNDKEAPPLTLTREDVGDALRQVGVSEEKIDAFHDKYEETFGERAHISAVNMLSPKQFEVRTPDVVIKVNPDRSELVTTRVIDGFSYILIRADEGVEVNGVNVKIARQEDVQ
ncbi:MAG: DUF4317 domain-containing protein [Clostridiales bacterium]|nr:DUF4317 domain-containing protein [Clostridiales bacterium]